MNNSTCCVDVFSQGLKTHFETLHNSQIFKDASGVRSEVHRPNFTFTTGSIIHDFQFFIIAFRMDLNKEIQKRPDIFVRPFILKFLLGDPFHAG